jgi:hypothetical protein
MNPLEIIKDVAQDVWRSLTPEEQEETPQAIMNRQMRRSQARSEKAKARADRAEGKVFDAGHTPSKQRGTQFHPDNRQTRRHS